MRAIQKKISCLPIFRSNKGQPSTGALIVELLVLQRALPLSEIQRQLYSSFKYKISYQGVRKIVRNLSEAGVLERKDDRYFLSNNWILNARAALDQLLAACSLEGIRQVAAVEDIVVYRADSLYSGDALWGDLLREACLHGKSKDRHLLSINHYAFWMPLNLGRETELFSELCDEGWDISFVFSQRSKLNTWAMKLYREIGIRSDVRKMTPVPAGTYYNVVGSRIIEVNLDKGLQNRVAEIKDYVGTSIPSAKLHSLSTAKGVVTIKIHESPLLAEKLVELTRLPGR